MPPKILLHRITCESSSPPNLHQPHWETLPKHSPQSPWRTNEATPTAFTTSSPTRNPTLWDSTSAPPSSPPWSVCPPLTKSKSSMALGSTAQALAPPPQLTTSFLPSTAKEGPPWALQNSFFYQQRLPNAARF